MSPILLLLFCGLLGLTSAWNQPTEANSCYVKRSVCSGDTSYSDDIKKIREVFENSVSTSLELISTSLQQLVAQSQQPLGSYENPARLCKDIPLDSPSREYWIQNYSPSPVQVYCDTSLRNCSCNTTTGGWMRVANLDMTVPSQQCPAELTIVNRPTAPLRTCSTPGAVGCVSITYPTHGIEYSRVCGRAIGYQNQTPDAFHPYFNNRGLTIDNNYVDGISLTHGQSLRQHVWTFAIAVDETRSDQLSCPCMRSDVSYTGVVPPFIGQDYFCATASRQHFEHIFYPDDPLWDGQGCGGTSTCCEFNNPPWFCKELPRSTTDDIEMRLCLDGPSSDEVIELEMVEIYVQ